MSSPDERRARIQIVAGEPTDEEVAALTAVLAAVSGPVSGAGADDRSSRTTSAWTDRAPLLRAPLPVGPHAWRTSVRGR